MDDASLFLKGRTVNLTDEMPEFSGRAMAEGEIDFAYGPFAVLEETQQTRYGITVSKTETEFYIVSNIENGTVFSVFSTSDKDMKSKLYNASNQWVNWFNSDDDTAPPDISINFKGRLSNQPVDDNYTTYYNEAMDDLSYIGIENNEYSPLRIVDSEITIVSVFLCFGGYILFAACVAIFIISFISLRKKQS